MSVLAPTSGNPDLWEMDRAVDFFAETLTVAIKRVTDDLVREGVRLG